jgi:hypothetical protein
MYVCILIILLKGYGKYLILDTFKELLVERKVTSFIPSLLLDL